VVQDVRAQLERIRAKMRATIEQAVQAAPSAKPTAWLSPQAIAPDTELGVCLSGLFKRYWRSPARDAGDRLLTPVNALP